MTMTGVSTARRFLLFASFFPVYSVREGDRAEDNRRDLSVYCATQCVVYVYERERGGV